MNKIVSVLENTGVIRDYIDGNRSHYLTEAEANIDVANFVRANSISDLLKIRNQAVNHIWKGLPPEKRLPDTVVDRTSDPRFKKLGEVKRVRELSVKMEHGLTVNVLLFETHTPKNSCLILYHQDHNAIFLGEVGWYQKFLAAGCDVLSVPLPLTLDAGPITVKVAGRDLEIKYHDDFKHLDNPQFLPLKFFLAPPTAALNFILKENQYDRIASVGLSGGGWLAAVLAALDNRITHAYPVAGSLPRYLSKNNRNRGDWEYSTPEFYKIANYFELYLLSAMEPNRRAVHIYNRRDNCCFNGILTAGFRLSLWGFQDVSEQEAWPSELTKRHRTMLFPKTR
ncbi:MAG: hypothetical protein VB913_15945 [Rhodospirillales bacterium]